MKTILGASLAALLFSASAMAATPNQGQASNEQVSASVSATVNYAPAVRDSTWALVNRTGSGSR
ncbi:MAG TPA: hypothetical protein VMF62_10045 [Acetobacteraceae bacterium]|nr:hypothetical protein [Acetobacteraceae bacterium]